MNIPWKIKSWIFSIIDILSLKKVLYFLQKKVTKRSVVKIDVINENWICHFENFKTLKNPKIFEFGAGKSLSQNIYFSQFSSFQLVVDLFPMLDLEQFNIAATQLSKICASINKNYCNSIHDIYKFYGIKYLAPADASFMALPDSSFDACMSTCTLEHIPRKTIEQIFAEIRRILRPGGLVSAIIDYSDHYSHTDTSIHSLHFLRYSEEEYEKFNHNCHYQNRLRHRDYEEIFSNLGFKIKGMRTLDFAEPPKKISKEYQSNESSVFAKKGIFLLEVKKEGGTNI